MRTTQTWTVSLPPNLLREAERTAKEEDRTKSELVREALRMYIEERRWRKLQRETAARAEMLGLRSEEDVVRLVHQPRALADQRVTALGLRIVNGAGNRPHLAVLLQRLPGGD